MVDAISSVNQSIRTELEMRKNRDIAWERLTPEQILTYASEGEDVPESIRKWAEEVNKLQDVPDDITYATSNGDVSQDDIEETRAQSDEPDADDAAAKVTLTQAQQFRQSMELSGESKYQQGKTMAKMSRNATSAEKNMEARLNRNKKIADIMGSVAERKANTNTRKTASMKQELNKLIQKAQNKDKDLTPADLNRIAELGTTLNMIGIQAQNELAQIGAQLAELEAEIQEFESVPPTATDFGTETVAIGAELMTNDTGRQQQITDAAKNANGIKTAKVALNAARLNIFKMMFNRNYRMGFTDVKTGGKAMDAGAKGVEAYTDATTNIDTEFTKLTAGQRKVEANTGIEGVAIPRISRQQADEEEAQTTTEETTETQTGEDNKKSEEVKLDSSKTEEKEVKDSTLVIDIDERKRRRQAVGLE